MAIDLHVGAIDRHVVAMDLHALAIDLRIRRSTSTIGAIDLALSSIRGLTKIDFLRTRNTSRSALLASS